MKLPLLFGGRLNHLLRKISALSLYLISSRVMFAPFVLKILSCSLPRPHILD